MANEIQKAFVKSFLDFLRKQIQDQTLSSDALESLEVALQCLEAAFEIHPDEESVSEAAGSSASETKKESVNLFELYQTTYVESNPRRKEIGENIKNEGNRLMKESKFQEALLEYNRAITYDPTNPVFYCNRAAAYIRLSEHEKAVADCKLALVYNPEYGKAYGRMGIAYSNLNKFDEARSSYQKALEIEPDNMDYRNNLQVAEERCTSGVGNFPAGNANIQIPPNLANLASQLGSAFGPGGAGGVGSVNAGGDGGPNGSNLANMLFNNISPNLRNLFEGMMQDPLITSTLQSVASNPEALIDMSRQVAAVINSENPDFMRSIHQQIHQYSQGGNDNDGPDNNQDGNPGGNNDPQNPNGGANN